MLALSVKACRLCQIPPFVAYATSSPGAGEVFPLRGAFQQEGNVIFFAKSSPFGGAVTVR